MANSIIKNELTCQILSVSSEEIGFFFDSPLPRPRFISKIATICLIFLRDFYLNRNDNIALLL